jgi:uncharacterized protein YkwD
VLTRLLPLTALVCLVALTAPAAQAAGDCTPAASWPATQPAVAGDVVSLINAHRAAMGLSSLEISAALTAAAEWKARQMAATQSLSHDDAAPTVRSFSDRLGACGYPTATEGENIAMGYASAPAVVNGWLASPEHRANIEDPDFRAIGVAAAGSPVYWAQDFGSVVDGAAPAPDVAAARSTAAPAQPRVRVNCALGGARVACRVRAPSGTAVRIALVRAGRTCAHAEGSARAGGLRLILRPTRRLSGGRYDIVVRARTTAGTAEQRLSLDV